MTGSKTAAWPEPGARITWAHFYPDGAPAVERSGVIWDRGPSVGGATVVAWVIPDEPLSTDPYCAIAVGKATRHLPVHGTYFNGCAQHVGKGTLYSSNYTGSPLGHLGAVAAQCAHAVRHGKREPRTDAELLAMAFHETYERLAPEHGYETREASAKPWDDVPASNRALMCAVAAELIARFDIFVPVEGFDDEPGGES